MKYSEYKDSKGIKGIWSAITYVLRWKQRELNKTVIFILMLMNISLILNPELAAAIRKYIFGMLK